MFDFAEAALKPPPGDEPDGGRHEGRRRRRAAAHVTGGGLPENLPRALPPGLGAEVRRGSWPIPPGFPYLQRLGDIPEEEMYRVFNMGLGMVLVLPQEAAEEALKLVEGFLVGRVVPGEGVRLV